MISVQQGLLTFDCISQICHISIGTAEKKITTSENDKKNVSWCRGADGSFPVIDVAVL